MTGMQSRLRRYGKLSAVLVLLIALSSGGPVDAAPLERSPCEAIEKPDFARYRERQMSTLRSEQTAAIALGRPIRVIIDADRDLGSEADYLARSAPGVRCEKITYHSDGLRIHGFLWTPANVSVDARLPLIVFHRGGTGEDSKLRPNTQFAFERFIRAGYAVIGSQYRGNAGSDGVDEMGGADVRDVLELVSLARTLPFIDSKNVYAIGYSRGAMMALSAARDGASFNASALVGLPADFRTQSFDRLFKNVSGDIETERSRRSAVIWADQLEMPVLILQGSGDPLVSVTEQTLPFAARLQALGKHYELVVYEGDTHGLIFNGTDRDKRILNWFERFRR